MRGYFISVEGMDGSGKTTQILLMKEYIEEKGLEVVLAREPGGTRIGEKVREILLDPSNTEMSAVAEMLLYASARAQLVAEVIKPSVEKGKVVICDRFVDSSYAYQGYGRGIAREVIASVNKAAIQGIMPDLTFFFDISPEVALARRASSTGTDRIEKERMDFHAKVYDGYRELAAMYERRIKTIKGGKSRDEIFGDVKHWLDRLIEA